MLAGLVFVQGADVVEEDVVTARTSFFIAEVMNLVSVRVTCVVALIVVFLNHASS